VLARVRELPKAETEAELLGAEAAVRPTSAMEPT
jgi:hypothetical protein